MFSYYCYYFCVNLILDLLVLFGVVLFVFILVYFYLKRFIFLFIYNFPFSNLFSSFSFSFFFDLLNVFIPSFFVYILVEPSFVFILNFNSLKEVYFSVFVKSSQWFWTYLVNDITFDSFLIPFSIFNVFSLLCCDTSIYIPLGIPFKFFFTSTDVIHSFTLFGSVLKMDCIPGRINFAKLSVTTSGIFYGMCSELCGVGHSFMPIQLECFV